MLNYYQAFAKAMKFNIIIILIFLFFSCQEKKKENIILTEESDKIAKTKHIEQSRNKIAQLEKEDIRFDTLDIFPRDTVIKSWNLTFKQISAFDFRKISKKQIITNFEQDDTSDILSKKDSCYYLTLSSKEKDTLCDFDDGEYHEKYTLKGFLKKANTLIFDWENWEEAHSILINLNEKKHWLLCPEYKVSPSKSRLVTFSNYIENPIYEQNELFLYELTNTSINQIYYFSNQDYGVFKTLWIDNNTILIKLKRVNLESFETKESYFFKITMK